MLDIYLVQYGFVLKQLQVFESLGTQRTQNNLNETITMLTVYAHKINIVFLNKMVKNWRHLKVMHAPL